MADKKPDYTKNIQNHNSPLFKRLTKLFSGPIVNFRAQKPSRERKYQLDKYASRFNSLQGLSYKKNVYNPFDSLRSGNMAIQSRAERYVDFEQMEFYPELASALDVYADEMTTFTEVSKLLKIDCHNEEIKNIIDTLFYKTLNIESNLFNWARTMCKYGDFFLYLDTDEVLGVKSAIGLPTQEIERLEGEDQTNPNYIQFQWNAGGLTFENWQIAHFRVLGNDKYSPYGTSVLDPARRIWRQLILIEDAMLVYRIVRAPDRRVFYVDVGNIEPDQIPNYMEQQRSALRSNQVIDRSTGRVDLRYNPMSVDEDYFIPVRGGDTGTKIDTLAGGQNTAAVEDVEYIQKKLFAALKIPKAYLGFDEALSSKATLAQEDIRFSRSVQMVQRTIVSELNKLAIIHLFAHGFTGEDLINFTLKLSNPSSVAQQQKLELFKSKFEIAALAPEGLLSKEFILKNIIELTDEEIAQAQEWTAQREAERAAEAAEAERIAALKVSARNKLVAGEPLTAEEAATIVL